LNYGKTIHRFCIIIIYFYSYLFACNFLIKKTTQQNKRNEIKLNVYIENRNEISMLYFVEFYGKSTWYKYIITYENYLEILTYELFICILFKKFWYFLNAIIYKIWFIIHKILHRIIIVLLVKYSYSFYLLLIILYFLFIYFTLFSYNL